MYTNPQDLVVFIGNDTVSASLSSPTLTHTFAFNPDEVKWAYSNNTVSRDTIGGRVIQLLSSRVEQMNVVGRAGSRGELQRLAYNLKQLMNYQIKSQLPLSFKVPSKNWHFKVYLQNVSSLGWDYAATSYPYELTLLVKQDLTGLSSKEVEQEALSRIAEGIGYSDKYHGGNAENALAISDAYSRGAAYLRSFSTQSGGTDQEYDVTYVGPGEVPDYGIAPTTVGSTIKVNFYDNIPELTFRNHTTEIPSFVWNKPYLYQWAPAGQTRVLFQQDAMTSFIKVVQDSGLSWIKPVGLLSTFRTYAEQVETYNDKPDLAAKPGTSYHELGIAIDVHEDIRNLPNVINAFTNNGWNRWNSVKEPWHWSYLVTG